MENKEVRLYADSIVNSIGVLEFTVWVTNKSTSINSLIVVIKHNKKGRCDKT